MPQGALQQRPSTKIGKQEEFVPGHLVALSVRALLVFYHILFTQHHKKRPARKRPPAKVRVIASPDQASVRRRPGTLPEVARAQARSCPPFSGGNTPHTIARPGAGMLSLSLKAEVGHSPPPTSPALSNRCPLDPAARSPRSLAPVPAARQSPRGCSPRAVDGALLVVGHQLEELLDDPLGRHHPLLQLAQRLARARRARHQVLLAGRR
eukprot:5286205-Prymnesium_polylepis.1